MKRSWWLSLVVVVGLLTVGTGFAGTMEDDLRYLGYSSELTDLARRGHADSHKKAALTPPVLESFPMSEADAVTEQLAELGRTRSLQADMPGQSDQLRDKLDGYWSRMSPDGRGGMRFLTPEFKNELKTRLANILEQRGFAIRQLELIDMPANLGIPQARAVIRAVRPLKTKNDYKEIQNNLAEIKQVSLEATTIDGVLYLSELTTFVAENPRNQYYYERTILIP
jgi:hypothetical protein